MQKKTARKGQKKNTKLEAFLDQVNAQSSQSSNKPEAGSLLPLSNEFLTHIAGGGIPGSPPKMPPFFPTPPSGPYNPFPVPFGPIPGH